MDLVHAAEVFVVAGVACQVAAVQIVDDVDYRIKEFHVVRYENESVFVVLQIACQPDDMLVVQIVGRFIEDQNRWIFEQQLDQKHFGSLPAGQIGNIAIQSDVAQTQTARDFLDLRVQLIEAAVFEDLLDLSGILHHLIHLVRVFRQRHILIQLEHFGLQVVHVIKRGVQDLADRHAFFEYGMLV